MTEDNKYVGRNLPSKVWGRLYWIETQVKTTKALYLFDLDSTRVHRIKMNKYRDKLLEMERNYVLFPNAYTYLLEIKLLIRTYESEIRT